MAASYLVDFQPSGRRGQCPPVKSLLDCARSLGLGIISICGGQGDCLRCRVQVIEGAFSAPSSLEKKSFSKQELQQGWRLACQAFPLSDSRISVPAESMSAPQRTQVEGLQFTISPEPAVSSCKVEMPAPAGPDIRADAERLLQALKEQHGLSCSAIDIDVLRELPVKLRETGWECRVSVRNHEVIALGSWAARPLGLAIDLGSTKLAGYLLDLNSGQALASRGIGNPQVSYGEDIVSRMTLSLKSPAEAKRLQELAVEACNQMAAGLCSEAGASTEEIVDAVIAGNTAMHHLLLGLPVKQLVQAPFIPAVSQALDIKARDIGLNTAPGAYVHMLPGIAGFLGGDHVAALLATENEWDKRTAVVIDIGTNTEVSLIHRGVIAAVSCASGPAFEGGHIQDGMRAAGGAIERLRIVDGRIQFQTIGNSPPVGICGSGILDAMSQLLLAGVLDKGGRMDSRCPGVRSRKDRLEFVLVDEKERNGNQAIVITQQDIRELQLAKAAIRTGLQVLVEDRGLTEDNIDKIVVAGAFGSYIAMESAVESGMLPSLPLDRFVQVGNAAGTGSRMALLSSSKRARAQAIASQVKYVELSLAPFFRETFLQASYLGKYKLERGKRKI